MKHTIFFLLFVLTGFFSNAQKEIVINELDCDTPGLDIYEFLELKSAKPNFPLDGYVVVFYNGSTNAGNTCYLSVDLDGYQTDVNGIFVIGSTYLVPFPQYIIPENVIQNGEDGVAIYKADATDFPLGIVAVAGERLVDVLVYGTNDPDATSMLQIFKSFDPNIRQVNEGNTNNTNSIQRKNDGTYYIGLPTPRRPNDGSGVIFTGIRTIFDKPKYTEGDTITLTFQADKKVETDLVIDFTLTNGAFNQQDFTGIQNVIFTNNTSSITTKVVLNDDLLDEGDEELLFRMAPLPEKYLILNNNINIRIEDNDFKVADFGTPTNPTYGKVKGLWDKDYYKNLGGKSGADLTLSLQNIIADPSIVKAQTYNDVIDILKEADQNPENSSQVWLVYLEKGRSKLDVQSSSANINVWNREHIWPRSRGGFNSIDADDQFNGKNIFWPTGPDSLRHANSDAHAIRAEDGAENSNRGNKFYGQYTGPAGTKGGFKGDVARSIFFLGVRYNGLQIVSGYPEGQTGKFGDLDTLLAWHRQDPPDDFEMNRNNVVQSWQNNRNPFIDIPDLVEYIYGNKINTVFQLPNSTQNIPVRKYKIYPNPTSNEIIIKGINGKTELKIFDQSARLVISRIVDIDTNINLNLTKGKYYLYITSNGEIYRDTILIQ